MPRLGDIEPSHELSPQWLRETLQAISDANPFPKYPWWAIWKLRREGWRFRRVERLDYTYREPTPEEIKEATDF